MIALPGGVVWHGSDQELADLLEAVWATCGDAASPTRRLKEEGHCGHMRATTCGLCGLLNSQVSLDKLLYGRRLAHVFIEKELSEKDSRGKDTREGND